MGTTIEEAIARAIYEHSETLAGHDDQPYGVCPCGWVGNGDQAFHQAQAVIEAIGRLTARQQASLLRQQPSLTVGS